MAHNVARQFMMAMYADDTTLYFDIDKFGKSDIINNELMKKINLMEKYPVYTKEILKANTKFKNVDEFIEALKQKVEADEIATYI